MNPRDGCRACVDIRDRHSGGPATGLTVWDGAKALTRYVEASRRKLAVSGKTVVELGSGCGLLAVALAHLGARVAATDLPGVLDNLRRNVGANVRACAPLATAARSRVRPGASRAHVFTLEQTSDAPGRVDVSAYEWGADFGALAALRPGVHARGRVLPALTAALPR